MRRAFDDDLARTIEIGSVWVSGPSGCGKTSAIRYLFETVGYCPLDICLSHCTSSSTRQDFIFEIIATANQLEIFGKNDRPPTYPALVSLLSEYSNVSSILLYLDEVPVSREGSNSTIELLNLISDLLNAVKQRQGRSDLQFVVSSITTPNVFKKGCREKLGEQIKVVSAEMWSNQDLLKLLNLILCNLRDLPLSLQQQTDLVSACRGSPRFMKSFIKDLLFDQPCIDDFTNALAKAKTNFDFS